MSHWNDQIKLKAMICAALCLPMLSFGAGVAAVWIRLG
jgi:hypothetical protein